MYWDRAYRNTMYHKEFRIFRGFFSVWGSSKVDTIFWSEAFYSCLRPSLSPFAIITLMETFLWFLIPLEWVIRTELTLKKGCGIFANDGHSQYWERPSLARITQPFYSVNSLPITNSKPHPNSCQYPLINYLYTLMHITFMNLQSRFCSITSMA